MSETNAGKNWTSLEEGKLVSLVKAGKSLDEISKELGRTRGSILYRMEEIVRSQVAFVDLATKIKEAL